MVWHNLVSLLIGPSSDDSPPVETAESVDKDEATVQESEVDNDLILNLILLIFVIVHLVWVTMAQAMSVHAGSVVVALHSMIIEGRVVVVRIVIRMILDLTSFVVILKTSVMIVHVVDVA